MIKNDLTGNPNYASFIYFDLETNPTGEVIDVGVYGKGEDDYTVMSFNEFLKYILTLKNATLVAHNGANFDFLFMVKPLCEAGYTITYGVSGNQGISMFCAKDKKKLRFIDSYRVTVSSLSKLTKSLGVESEKVQIDTLPHILKETDSNLYYQYLKNDVLGLCQSYETFMGQFSKYNLGKNPPLTAASLALKIFKNHLTHPILVSTRKTREFERKSYFGGVCYCEKPQTLDVNVYDVNSMYPAVMAKNEFPLSYVGHYTDEFKRDALGLWAVEITEDYPGLPFTFDSETRTLTKKGNFILDTGTVSYLRSISVHIGIKFGYVYLQTGKIFEYYNQLYLNRVLAQQQGDVANAYALKIVLNSLYGKFGQKDERKIISSYSQELTESLLADSKPFKTNEEFIFYTESEFQKTAFPAIASLVTLRARLLLRQLAEGLPVVYADTDSLHLPIGYELPVSSELGGLKLEYSGKAVYIGKKLYCLVDADKYVHKGLPKNILSTDDYFNMLQGERIAREFEAFPTVRDVLELGKQPGVLSSKVRTLGIT